jgi:hypothetical protein
MANLNRSILYWWNGEGYIGLTLDGNSVGTITNDDGELALFPEEAIQEFIPEHRRDGWRVVVDKHNKHVAVLGNSCRHYTVKNLAWRIEKAMDHGVFRLQMPSK